MIILALYSTFSSAVMPNHHKIILAQFSSVPAQNFLWPLVNESNKPGDSAGNQ